MCLFSGGGSHLPLINRSNNVSPAPIRRDQDPIPSTHQTTGGPQQEQFQEFSLDENVTPRAPIPDEKTLYYKKKTESGERPSNPPPTTPSRVWGEPLGKEKSI